MSLYPKKLSNVEELRREQAQLKKQIEKMSFTDVFSIDNLVGSGAQPGEKKEKNKAANEADDSAGSKWDFVLELLPMAYPLLEPAMNMAKEKVFSFFKSGSKKTKKMQTEEGVNNEEKGGNIVRDVALEILTGYLKWKAIELSYKGIKLIIKKRNEKKAIKKLHEEMG